MFPCQTYVFFICTVGCQACQPSWGCNEESNNELLDTSAGGLQPHGGCSIRATDGIDWPLPYSVCVLMLGPMHS